VSPFRLYGVAAHDPLDAPALPPGVLLLPFRDLAAVASESRHARPSLGPQELETHRAAVAAVFARGTILPAPPGVVFRAREALARWMELHYITLSDAIGFVEGRAVARVHVGRRSVHAVGVLGGGETEELAVDVDSAAADVFRILRRHAVAAIAIRPEPGQSAATSAAATSSFLVERDRWRFFEDVVAEEGRRDPELLFRLTGPWPPYDFVRMEFGG
jgi:hypothetical protein